jgi:Signal transduction histidine kinase
MIATFDERHRAAIEYEELRRPFNTVRAAAAAALLVVGAIGWFGYGLRAGAAIAPMALVVIVSAVLRRNRGRSPLPDLLLDTTFLGVGLALRGSVPAVQVAAFLYLLIAAMLLLPLLRAAVVVLYAAAWEVFVIAGPGIGLRENPAAAASFPPLLDGVSALVFVLVIATIVFWVVRTLLLGQDRQRRALEAERRAVELKNEFVSMVSHELRTPLTSIAGFTEALRETWRDLPEDEVEEFLAIMRGETEHLANLVEDILVIPRLEAGRLRLEPEELDITPIAFEIAELVLKDGKEYAVSLSGRPLVYADPTRLRQILRNLLENARKYGGDQILIEGSERPDDGTYEIVVSDNGPGVPERDRDRIFEHFEQLSKGDGRLQQGVGLGLPIARKLAHAMGGDLWYEARFPVGARFCFTLPQARPTGAEARHGGTPAVA